MENYYVHRNGCDAAENCRHMTEAECNTFAESGDPDNLSSEPLNKYSPFSGSWAGSGEGCTLNSNNGLVSFNTYTSPGEMYPDRSVCMCERERGIIIFILKTAH